MSSIFLRPADYYQQNINPIVQYFDQSAYYLSKMTGAAFDQCRQYVVDGIKTNKFEGVQDPLVEFYERNEQGDRAPAFLNLSRYLASVVREDLIIVPTHTCYVKPKVKKSLLAGFTIENKTLRNINKKAAGAAKAEGNMELFIFKNNEQDNNKRYNNSMSGAMVAGGSVINNPTGHSTLTSITRTVGSLGNASNEKIIAGNRHYRSADVVLNNVIAITSQIDKDELTAVMQKFGLHYPTVAQTEECIKYSSDLYWSDEFQFKKIRDYLNKLEPVELAAIVYVGDFYHLRKYNEKFVHTFVTKLAKKVKGVVIEDALAKAWKLDELVMNYAHQVCITEMRGKGKKYDKLSPESLNTLVATGLNIEAVIEEYRDLVNAIFLTKIIPASTAYIPDMIRRSVVLSDTDSTMFSCDEWVNWYFGELNFDDEGFALSGAVMYIATQCIAHTLAVFSANMNVVREDLFTLSMKPEFLFPVFAQTTVAKHYYTITFVKEGSVYAEPEMEIKGVHLKSSASPREIIKDAAATMKEILLSVMNDKKLSIQKYLDKTISMEQMILKSLRSGEVKYLKTSKIKNKEAYSLDEFKSPYQHHQMWLDVFVPKYHYFDNPTYGVLKIPTIMHNRSRTVKWLAEMKDRDLAQRMTVWMEKYNKKNIGTFYISTQYAASYGIPEEILSVMDTKSIIMDLTNIYRMILGTLGYFPKANWLLSDQLLTEEDQVNGQQVHGVVTIN